MKAIRCLAITVIYLLAIPFASSGSTVRMPNVAFNSLSTQHGLSQSSVFCMAQDNFGYLWIGTRFGLNRFDGYEFRKYYYDPVNSNSLSNNEITSIYVDLNNDVWVGTRGGGLNRYLHDRNIFVRYSNLNYENTVTSIDRNSDGTLWVGTTEGLLKAHNTQDPYNTYFENVSVNAILRGIDNSILPHEKKYILVESIHSIGADSVLIGTDSGLFLYLHREKRFIQVNIGVANNNKVTSINKSSNSIIWVATFNGLMRVQVTDNNWSDALVKEYSPYATNENHKLLAERVEDVTSDPLGNIWVATRGGGLSRIDPNGYLTHFVSDLSDPSSLQDNIINSLLVDNYGVLWIGTESRGCNYLDLFQKKFIHIREIGDRAQRSGNNMITAITGHNPDEIWVGTALQGFARVSVSPSGAHSVKNIPNVPVASTEGESREIMSLLLDDQNHLWIGTATNSLNRYHPDKGFQSYITNGYVFAIHQDARGQIWYGTWGQGLGIYDKEKDEVRQVATNTNLKRSLSGDRVLSLFDDSEGNLWVGTKGSGVNVIPLDLISRGTADFVYYSHNPHDPTSLSHDDVFCITQDSKGRIWVGTGNGLNQVLWPDNENLTEAALKNDLRFKPFLEKDGLPNSVIYSIIEDDNGKLWLSTYKGLSVFNPETGSFKNYVRNDGLQDDEFHYNAYTKASNGFIFLGGTNGLTMFHPDSIKPNPFSIKPLITGIKIYNEQLLPGHEVNGRVIIEQDVSTISSVNLLHKDKEITFEFSGLYFANPKNLQYSYRLVGFNDSWQFTRNNARSVTYTNLDDGEYIFQVRVANADGILSDEIAELRVLISPPWWRKPWSYTLYILIILFLLLTFRRYSIIGINEKNRLQIERIENAKLREITDAKMKFFTNISHEIRTPLTLIKDPLEQVIAHGKIDTQSREYLSVMKKNVDRLYELVNQLLQLRRIDLGKVKMKLETIPLNKFIIEIASFFENYANLKGVSIRMNLPQEHIYLCADREQLKTILYNLLSNAIKHSPKNGEVAISIYQQEGSLSKDSWWLKLLGKNQSVQKWIVIDISDKGDGIAKEEIERVFQRFYQVDRSSSGSTTGSGIGLSLVKEYVEMHKGVVTASSSPSRGSVFKVLFPDIQHDRIIEPDSNRDQAEPLPEPLPPADRDPLVELNIAESPTELSEPSVTNEFIPELNDQNEPESLSPKSLLIIEDDHDLADYLAQHLKNEYSVTCIYDGQEAMEHIALSPPSIVISDVMLPGLSGLEICQNIKTNPNTSHIPLILLTAQSAEENVLKGYESGADLYVSKPFSIEIIKKQLKTLLQNRQSLRETYSKKILVQPTDIDVSSPDERFLKRFMEIVDKHLSDSDFDVSSLVGYMNMSHTKILRKVKTITGLSLVEFIRDFRLKKAAIIMHKQKLPVAEVGYMVGFSDPKYFSKCFVKMYGKTPTEYYQENHPEELDSENDQPE